MDSGEGSLMHLDTHVVVWLASGNHQRVPLTVRQQILASTPMVSPMVALELELLHEIGRIGRPGAEVLDHLEAAMGLTLAAVPFASAVVAARSLRWTRDPFDRLIVGSAAAQGAQLVTADELIRANYPLAVWA